MHLVRKNISFTCSAHPGMQEVTEVQLFRKWGMVASYRNIHAHILHYWSGRSLACTCWCSLFLSERKITSTQGQSSQAPYCPKWALCTVPSELCVIHHSPSLGAQSVSRTHCASAWDPIPCCCWKSPLSIPMQSYCGEEKESWNDETTSSGIWDTGFQRLNYPLQILLWST